VLDCIYVESVNILYCTSWYIYIYEIATPVLGRRAVSQTLCFTTDGAEVSDIDIAIFLWQQGDICLIQEVLAPPIAMR
jgi:hypothetical protein